MRKKTGQLQPIYSAIDVKELLEQYKYAVTEREAFILEKRLELYTLEEIAVLIERTRDRVRQLERQAQTKLLSACAGVPMFSRQINEGPEKEITVSARMIRESLNNKYRLS
jgi:DNA-binding CsgD family transcriptional regulator